jgi:hypothetical protein
LIEGISLLASSQTEDTDVLWVTSADPFPFQTPLKEMQVNFGKLYRLGIAVFLRRRCFLK